MNANASIQKKLLQFICKNYMVEQEDIVIEQSLVDQGIIDSFGLIEISGFLKSEFGLSVIDSEMNRDNFGSVYKLTLFIQKKLTQPNE